MTINKLLSNWEYYFTEINKLLDKSFKDYIKNKSVIIIGPSEFLTNKKLKEFIDKNDIVIRLNLGHKLTLDKNNKDFVTKTNIVYLNQKMRYFGNNYQNKIIQDFENQNYPEYIILNCAGLPKLIDDHICDNNYTHIVHSDLFKIKKILNININLYMGTQVILEILSCQPSQLVLLGMDFYKNKCCQTYTENNIKFDKEYEISDNENNKNHITLNNYFDFNLFTIIYGIKDVLSYLKNTKIILDSFLDNLIEENKNSHNNFT